MSYMLDEIHQQPDVMARVVQNERRAAEQLAAEIERRDIQFAMLAARGTSDHAAIYGKYLLEINNGIPVALADPSVFTLYESDLKLGRALVIGISQSGKAADVCECLRRSKEAGALTVGITNEAASPITGVADHAILCNAGEELGVAATKTYTSTLAALYLLSASLSHTPARIDALLKCADAMRAALGMQDYIADRAERFRYMQEGYVISRGFNYCTALEIALKLAETSYIGLIGYSAADFLHGPIAAVHENEACFLCAPPGRAYPGMLEMAGKLRERAAETVILSSEAEILALATTACKLDAKVDEELSPLVYVIPGQLLAYHLAVARGYDPDRPRGLSKVTITR